MSFFDAFTGKSSRKDVISGAGQAQQWLDSARNNAAAAYRAGQEPARADLTSGFAGARGDISRGMTDARSAIGGGYDQARGDITGQYGRAEDALTGAYDRTSGLLSPLIDLGRSADASYRAALGLDGAGARSSWLDQNVRGNPDFAYADELAAKELEAKLNAQGITGGRAGALLTRQGAQRVEDRTNQLLDRIRSAGDRGAQYAGQLAGYSQQTGQGVAGLRSGLGDRLSGLETGRGNALADLAYRGNAALGDVSAKQGSALAELGMGTAKQIGDLEYGYGQQSAANTINASNAVAGTRNVGMNNLLGLAGLGLKAFTPGIGGMTPAGNIWGGIKSAWG